MGWIRLDRKITDNWLWEEKPFSRGQAWIDLILMANHKDNKFPFGDKIITVERGDFITSELKLMERWGWSKSRVRLFLLQLQNDSMIVKKSDHKKTTVTIVNYGVYQDIETTERPVKDHKKTSKEPVKDTNNKETSITSNNIKTYSDIPELNSSILDFIEFRKTIKVPMTDKAISLVISKLNKFSPDVPIQIAILNQSIERGWRGIFPLKDDAQQANPQSKPQITNKQLQYPQRAYTSTDYAELEKKLLRREL